MLKFNLKCGKIKDVKVKLRLLFILSLLSISVATYFLAFNRSILLLSSFISALSFWGAISLLLPKSFYRAIFWDIKKTKAYWIPMVVYFIFHLLIYGFFYFFILGYVNFLPVFKTYIGAAVPTPLYLLPIWESYSPGVAIFIAGYEADIVPFSAFIGLILSMLLGANVQRVIEVKNSIKQANLPYGLVGVTVLAIVSGTSCCISFPSLVIYMVALSIGAVSVVLKILASPIYFALVWYGLPIISALLLYINLRNLNRVLKRIQLAGCEVCKK